MIISGCSPYWIQHILMLINYHLFPEITSPCFFCSNARLVVHPQSFVELGGATRLCAVPITTQALGGIFVSRREMWFVDKNIGGKLCTSEWTTERWKNNDYKVWCCFEAFPSLPVIPAQVNGLWGRFYDSLVVQMPHKVFGSLGFYRIQFQHGLRGRWSAC